MRSRRLRAERIELTQRVRRRTAEQATMEHPAAMEDWSSLACREGVRATQGDGMTAGGASRGRRGRRGRWRRRGGSDRSREAVGKGSGSARGQR